MREALELADAEARSCASHAAACASAAARRAVKDLRGERCASSADRVCCALLRAAWEEGEAASPAPPAACEELVACRCGWTFGLCACALVCACVLAETTDLGGEMTDLGGEMPEDLGGEMEEESGREEEEAAADAFRTSLREAVTAAVSSSRRVGLRDMPVL